MNVPERGSRPSRFPLLIAIALVLAGVAGATGYFFGWSQGQSAIHQATLRISVENRLTVDLTANLLINGKIRQSMVIPRGQVVSVDQQVTFADPDGAFFHVEAVSISPPGPRDDTFVPVTTPGTYLISLRLG